MTVSLQESVLKDMCGGGINTAMKKVETLIAMSVVNGIYLPNATSMKQPLTYVQKRLCN